VLGWRRSWNRTRRVPGRVRRLRPGDSGAARRPRRVGRGHRRPDDERRGRRRHAPMDDSQPGTDVPTVMDVQPMDVGADLSAGHHLQRLGSRGHRPRRRPRDLIVMENKGLGSCRGSAAAPYFQLAPTRCGYSDIFVDKPVRRDRPRLRAALPALTRARTATRGLSPTGTPLPDHGLEPLGTVMLSTRSVFDRFASWRAYQEDMGSACNRSGTTYYAPKHNRRPFSTRACGLQHGRRSSRTLAARPRRTRRRVHARAVQRFTDDLAHDSLPALAFVTPDLANDMHDGTVTRGRQTGWFTYLPLVFASPAYLRRRTSPSTCSGTRPTRPTSRSRTCHLAVHAAHGGARRDEPLRRAARRRGPARDRRAPRLRERDDPPAAARGPMARPRTSERSSTSDTARARPARARRRSAPPPMLATLSTARTCAGVTRRGARGGCRPRGNSSASIAASIASTSMPIDPGRRAREQPVENPPRAPRFASIIACQRVLLYASISSAWCACSGSVVLPDERTDAAPVARFVPSSVWRPRATGATAIGNAPR